MDRCLSQDSDLRVVLYPSPAYLLYLLQLMCNESRSIIRKRNSQFCDTNDDNKTFLLNISCITVLLCPFCINLNTVYKVRDTTF